MAVTVGAVGIPGHSPGSAGQTRLLQGTGSSACHEISGTEGEYLPAKQEEKQLSF